VGGGQSPLDTNARTPAGSAAAKERGGAHGNVTDVIRAVEDAAGHVTLHVLRRSFASLAARRGVDPVQAARMTGHTLGTWTRFHASDYGKAQRDEALERMLGASFGAIEEEPPC
jgi:integrase